MTQEEILKNLSENYPWRRYFHYVKTIGSTNDTLKQWAADGAPHGTVLVSDEQTGGRGRLGRSFHSPEGTGVYLSILLRPNCRPEEIMHLTCAAAAAMAEAVEAAAGFRPSIKWTNDLVYGRKKLGGILTELGLSSKGLDYCIIGIGINCLQKAEDFPPELQGMAASLSMAAGKRIVPASLAASMMEALFRMDQNLLSGKEEMLQFYRKNCITLGTEISLVRGSEVRHGKALDVDENGALLVEFAPGQIEAISSGEVSIRGMYGYV